MQISDDPREELWFGDSDPRRSYEEARRSLAAAIGRATGLKPFPAVVQQVLSRLQNADYRMGEVIELIGKDPALSAGFLRLANSVLFRRLAACDSIGAAVMRLGRQNVRDNVTAIAMLGMFREVKGYGMVVRNHCAGVAAVSRCLATEKNLRGADQVFLCGLLHDVGKLLCIETGEINYDVMSKETLASVDVVHDRERERLGYDHAVLAGHVLTAWRIPEPVPQVVAWHHQPGRAYNVGGPVGMMVALLRLADAIDSQLKQDPSLSDAFIEQLAHGGEADYLGFSSSDLRAIRPVMLEARTEVLSIFS
jgi:HD-like signal output (HDOD) protein